MRTRRQGPGGVHGSGRGQSAQVAVHEFGHSLGLGHSEVDAAVMAPFYTGYDPNFALHPDDIAGIQTLYGPNVGSPDITMRPEEIPSDVPCTGQFDTITRTSDGGTYAFKGNMVFKLDNNAIGLESGFPTEISSVFADLPNDLDASVFYEDVGKTYFFKGNQYYRFSGTTLDSGYPLSISAKWNGLPNDLDAAFVWSGNGRVYFIKGNQYYRYNRYSEAVDAGYPRPLSVWRGLPASVESAMQWSNSRTYFFSGEEYYRFNDRSFRVDTSYPRSTVQYWIGCELEDLMQATTPTSGSNTFYMSSLAVIMLSSLISLQLRFTPAIGRKALYRRYITLVNDNLSQRQSLQSAAVT
ncbi:hypothetical protein BSL78_00946 [Apostichopus japonicus]|uniref:Peptidase M10 metallopeptidase domain-containing protein n=1 Tax=Stichopus japonicus TaxID=307972 RepID=A0A2G8LPD9_STIJA|nr:hypothetical protein BSL78_00946 [Apostichopus japonicus]